MVRFLLLCVVALPTLAFDETSDFTLVWRPLYRCAETRYRLEG